MYMPHAIMDAHTHTHTQGAIALAEVLAESKHLTQLDLKDNDIRVAGLMALQLGHRMNQTLLAMETPKSYKVDQVSILAIVPCTVEPHYRGHKNNGHVYLQTEGSPSIMDKMACLNMSTFFFGSDAGVKGQVARTKNKFQPMVFLDSVIVLS